MRSKRTIFHQESISSEGVNLTPLIDVVFVVLILFILIAPMVEIDRVKLAEGPSRDHPEKAIVDDAKSLVIHVKEDNTVWVGHREIGLEVLGPLLKALHAKNPDRIPQLYQDERAVFGTYQKVKNAVEEAGFSELDIVLDSKR